MSKAIALAVAAVVSLAVLATASAEPSTTSPVPRLAEFRVKNYGSGYQELLIKFAGDLRSCDVVTRPARIKIVFKGKGANWRATNTWCMDGCGCALGEGIWVPNGTDFGGLFENTNDALAARTLALSVSDAFGGVSYHKTLNLGYWVSANGKLLRSGRLQVRIDASYRTIWEGTDDFINICINDTEKLYSSGGRLYCLSRVFDSSMKLLR